jgi:hypothetical protein
MTFTDALKALAGKYPEKFEWYDELIDGEQEVYLLTKNPVHYWDIDTLTQDDIDEILGLIGWRYYVEFLFSLDAWFYSAWSEEKISSSVYEGKPTKLLAAQAALIAVVEKVTP